MHEKHSEFAGRRVKLSRELKTNNGVYEAGTEYIVEDWWDRVAGKSWMFCDGNPACLMYAIRSGFLGLPTDNEVLYGKIGAFGHLVHVSEISAS